MKILVITAFYPPYHSGGYGLRVKNIMDGLSVRGHSICVLTNLPEKGGSEKDGEQPYPVLRKLYDRRKARFFPKEILFDLLDTRLLQQQIDQFKPDVIYLGHTYILSKALLPFLARQHTPVVYDEGGIGLIEAWSEHGRWFRFNSDYQHPFTPLNALKPLVIKLVGWVSRGRINQLWSWPGDMRIIFNSELNRGNAQRESVPCENSTVIHSGVDTDLFSFRTREKLGSPLRILVPGRIERRKGQLDAVHLVKALVDEGIDTRLVLAGAGWADGYYDEVMASINYQHLSDKVTILPMLTPQELAVQYHKADICFFPSYFRTGFSRVPLEAMACGCVVITYGNEGSVELITNNKNGFIVQEQDYSEIITMIKKLTENIGEVSAITQSARKQIEEEHPIKEYVNNIEGEITSVIRPSD